MNQADVFYRAFIDYRKQTLEDSKCKKLRGAIAAASPENEKLEVISSHCVIKEDWVNRIYEGLPFIEKIIHEERQFITQQGEVVPIEKAKRISKTSVEHLAKHSDMITHEPEENADIIPDELYIVEKLSDYAVYENRFIYMLLCYLRDFIDLRYSKIIEEYNKYRASMIVDKSVKIGKRIINCKIDFYEESKDDPFGYFDGHTDGLLKKIEEERHIIAAMLLTPLMKIVAKSPMIKPPITRTNALKMNNNLKNALALYDYIAAYRGDGYKIEYNKKTYGPFSDMMGDEFAEIISLNSFLVYEYGKDLKKKLQEAYESEEERRRLEAEERHLLLLKDLKARLEETGVGYDEYLLQLETRNRELEEDRIKLGEAREYIATLEGNILDYRRRQNEYLSEIDGLREENLAKEAHIKKREEEFIQEKTAMTVAHEAEKTAMTAAHESEKKQITDGYELKLEEQRVAAETEKREITEKHTAEMTEMKSSYEEIITSERQRFEQEIADSNAARQRFSEENEALREEKSVLKAEIRAQKQINGTVYEDGDFTERERFAELEEEYAAIKKLRDAEWKKAKKTIRKRVLWRKDANVETDVEPNTADKTAPSVETSEMADTAKTTENAGGFKNTCVKLKNTVKDVFSNKIVPVAKDTTGKVADLFKKLRNKICEILRRKR